MKSNNLFILFREFVMALSAASVVNRLRLVETLFHVFDLDSDGKITKDEIAQMLHTLVDVTNSNDKRRHHHHKTEQQDQNKDFDLQKRIDDAFNELNANDDDHITKDEFIEWYMKSGLISDVQTNELTVPDSSRIQQLGKKSRKLMKQSSNMKSNNEQEENRPRPPPLARHMSRMTERKSSSRYDDDDNDNHINVNNNPTTVSSSHYYDDNDIDDERVLNNPIIRVTNSSDDTDSHYSKENERWQHLFNSVLGQIRSQRVKDTQQPDISRQTTKNNFNSWKREGEEKLKAEYVRQKSNDKPNRSHLPTTKREVLQSARTISGERSSSPDIVTIRL
jgi:Ca2+-binding EF-hand superfamily protein